MRLAWLPRTYLAFVIVTLVEPPLVTVLQGERIHPSTAGLIILALLLYALGRGSMLAWALFVLWNLVLTFAIGVTTGGEMLLSGWLMLALSVARLALLVSPSMRAHVGLGRPGHAGPAHR